jgi:hypothetical protein
VVARSKRHGFWAYVRTRTPVKEGQEAEEEEEDE